LNIDYRYAKIYTSNNLQSNKKNIVKIIVIYIES